MELLLAAVLPMAISCFFFRDEIFTGISAGYEEYKVSVSGMKSLMAAVLAMSNISFLFQG